MSDLYFVLWQNTSNPARWADLVRHSLGYVPDNHDRLRIGGLAGEPQRLSHEVSTYVRYAQSSC
jgi:hypothetical protein